LLAREDGKHTQSRMDGALVQQFIHKYGGGRAQLIKGCVRAQLRDGENPKI
jgi:hypothetical protein